MNGSLSSDQESGVSHRHLGPWIVTLALGIIACVVAIFWLFYQNQMSLLEFDIQTALTKSRLTTLEKQYKQLLTQVETLHAEAHSAVAAPPLSPEAATPPQADPVVDPAAPPLSLMPLIPEGTPPVAPPALVTPSVPSSPQEGAAPATLGTPLSIQGVRR